MPIIILVFTAPFLFPDFVMLAIAISNGEVTFFEILNSLNIYSRSFFDSVGGKTPEETYNMFVIALKAGNLNLASKYFVLEKQDDWFKTLSQYQARDLLAYLISELKNNKEDWKKNYNGNSVEFYYKVVIEEDSYANFKGQKVPIEAGEYSNTVRFEKYPSGVWKISLL